MPELPEVETTRRGIEPLVRNRQVERVLVHNSSLRWPVPADLDVILAGQKVTAVGRRAKYLLVRCDRGTLIIHLGMTGHLRICRHGEALRKHDHFELLFTDGSVLRFNDSRRFGALFWTGQDPLQHERLAALGPEPLGEQFNADYLYRAARGRKVAVKPFIMDAGVVVGVGNIYASEALFRAGIAPARPAGRVGRVAYTRLVRAVREVLAEAIDAGGTTIRDFSGTDGRPGYFKQELCVYGRTEQPCVKCHAPVRQLRLGQRSTYFCPVCQK